MEAISGEVLVCALAHYDVPFLFGDAGAEDSEALAPAFLLAALATHTEARVRLALIPLLLRWPEFAGLAPQVALTLPPDARLYFQCFYMAAWLLQTIHRGELERYLGAQPALPDLFSHALGLAEASPEACLRLLGQRQTELSGRTLNWTGTYQHALQGFLATLARERRWGLR